MVHGGMEKYLDPHDIRPDKKIRLVEASVNMRFGGKVYDGFYATPKKVLHQLLIAYVTLDIPVIRRGGEIRQVLQVSSVGQFVKI
jgi:hypothetical protein